MLELFSAETSIVVGLDLNDDEQNLIRSAVTLAQKTTARLVFVHAVPPFHSYAAAGDDMNLPYEAFEHDLFAADLNTSEQKLEALRDRLPPELVIDLRVMRLYPEEALRAVAEDVNAALIICGMRGEHKEEWFGGMSTALSLMETSQFPVMVLPLQTFIDFTSKDHNILVADNLREEGLFALRAALGLCKSIDYRQLIHLHVKKTTYRNINETVEKIRLAMIEGRVPSNPDFEADVYLKSLKDELKRQMSLRLENADRDFAQGLHWTPRVRFGHPADEMRLEMRGSKSDILVFGKHHVLRTKNLEFGKIPYQSMLEKNVASIVVPTALTL